MRFLIPVLIFQLIFCQLILAAPPNLEYLTVCPEDEPAPEEDTKQKSKYKPEDHLVTSAPPLLAPRTTVQPFGCKRQFMYRGILYGLDTYYKKDAEGLRPFVQDYSPALQELETYQHNRVIANKFAYIGTFGLTVALASMFLRKFRSDTTEGFYNIAFKSGLIIGAASFIYSFTLLVSNESHLEKAVLNHNQANPENEIVLKLGTQIIF